MEGTRDKLFFFLSFCFSGFARRGDAAVRYLFLSYLIGHMISFRDSIFVSGVVHRVQMKQTATNVTKINTKPKPPKKRHEKQGRITLRANFHSRFRRCSRFFRLKNEGFERNLRIFRYIGSGVVCPAITSNAITPDSSQSRADCSLSRARKHGASPIHHFAVVARLETLYQSNVNQKASVVNKLFTEQTQTLIQVLQI